MIRLWCWIVGHDMHTLPASGASGHCFIYCIRCNKLVEL